MSLIDSLRNYLCPPALRAQVNTLAQQVEHLIMDQIELAAQLDAVTAELTATTEQVAKVGAETDSLIVEVQSLKDLLAGSATVPPEVEAALGRVLAQADALKAATQVVDDKVPDEPAA